MNTEILYSAICQTIQILESAQDFFPIITALNNAHEEATKSLSGQINTNVDHSTLWQNFSAQQSSLTKKAGEAVRLSKFSKITKSITKIENEIPQKNITTIQEVKVELEKFIIALDNHLDNASLSSAYTLTLIANRFFIAFNKLKYLQSILIQTTAKELINDPPKTDNLKIYFPNRVSLEDFSDKLIFLSVLFEECCNLLNLSLDEGQVEIQKIESGSFFAKISANPIVIALATTIITQSAILTYSKFDPSQNINNLKQSTEVLEKILGVRAVLKANNIETENLDESIKKSTSIIAKNLTRFLGDSTEIKINNETFSTYSYDIPKINYTHQLALEDLNNKDK
ncbi:hypothetical protein [Pseudomonas salmasensis]|uniref:hypothetical protein n=1 Tax=Pseudomonas salmasensis TaxID=2745514 RepID=UPI001647901F|nr:hypothetical protein [Pseudomonas salmasensis]QXH79916.1 hypothetical protein HU731_009020 [Pseudomonas salmasensis]